MVDSDLPSTLAILEELPREAVVVENRARARGIFIVEFFDGRPAVKVVAVRPSLASLTAVEGTAMQQHRVHSCIVEPASAADPIHHLQQTCKHKVLIVMMMIMTVVIVTRMICSKAYFIHY